MFAQPSSFIQNGLVNGTAGVVITIEGRPVSVMGFTVANRKIVEIDGIVDPARPVQFDLTALNG